jgi:hypothetical protein
MFSGKDGAIHVPAVLDLGTRMVRLLLFPWKDSVVNTTVLNKESEYKISEISLMIINVWN